MVLLPDGGRGYLGKIFNDKWMRSYGFAHAAERAHRRATCSRPRPTAPPPLVYVHPSDTVRDAIDRMTRTGVSQLLVLTAEPPVVLGEVARRVDEDELLDGVFTGEAKLTDAVRRCVGEPLPLIGVNEPVATARGRARRRDPRCS